ncbi:uncharacterized protein LOC135493014 [Lineus longissimus]|uniref:uncharacterized protein LOC135493014 n=1 Tax=Lineus longissimus TaxID=88925 RepID=UPI00315CB615
MLQDARVTGMRITKPRRCRQASLVLIVFLITINLINLFILTRCTSSLGQSSNENTNIRSVLAGNTESVDYAGDQKLALQRGRTQDGAAWIPKIVHLTWKNTVIPGSTANWVKKWTKTNPGYEVWFWTDDDARNFIRKHYSYFFTKFQKYPTAIFRADAIRYFILYHFGGIYADLDIEPLKSLDPIRQKYACVIATEPNEHAEIAWNFREGEKLACNAFMACRPHHPFLRLLIDMLDMQGIKESNVVVATGPVMLTRTLKIYNNINKLMTHDQNSTNAVFLAPSNYFIPRIDQQVIDGLLPHCGEPNLNQKYSKFCEIFNRGDFHNGPTRESFTDHHWWHSWFIKLKKSKPKSIAAVIPYVTLARTLFESDSVEKKTY